LPENRKSYIHPGDGFVPIVLFLYDTDVEFVTYILVPVVISQPPLDILQVMDWLKVGEACESPANPILIKIIDQFENVIQVNISDVPLCVRRLWSVILSLVVVTAKEGDIPVGEMTLGPFVGCC